MSNRDLISLHRDWWTRKNQRMLVGVLAPVPVPYGGLDIDVPPSQIAERKRRVAEAMAAVPGDKLNVAGVNFSTAFVPSLAGAGFAYDAHTSWSVPVAACAADLRINAFDPAAPLFEAYLRRLEPLLEHWSWDTYLPGHADYLGPLDILSGMLGPEALAFEMMDHPDDVRAKALEAADFLRAMLDHELGLFRQAGLEGGVTDCFATWLPGRGVRFSEDMSALVGDSLFRDCFVEADAAWLAGLDSAFLHTHSAALACLPAMLEIPNLGAIEIGNDPNGPPMAALVAAARRVQAAGKPVQVSNWEHPLTEAELGLLLSSLDPAGLCITVQARSLDEAHALYRRCMGQ
jgi:hypothetical protein